VVSGVTAIRVTFVNSSLFSDEPASALLYCTSDDLHAWRP
jgi:hypothetical protein